MSTDKITLTGATLSGDVELSHSHSHSHSHSRGHSHAHGHGETQSPESAGANLALAATVSQSIEDVMNSSFEDIAKSLSTLLRFGRYEALEPLLEQLVARKPEQLPQILAQVDDGGHSVLHWAAKRVDDIRFLHTLVEVLVQYNLTKLLNSSSQDNVGMTPLHWACTESSIPHVALLWKKGADVEARDASGCTPLLIAAQYGQVEVVAYLLKNGANIQAVDTSRDTALHWAAYKGSIQVCGLLAFYDTLKFTTQDAYGQTPLHLAALRGHTSVVRYIILHLSKKDKEILFLKDKNGRTPLDLAIHKNRPNVQVVLKEAMAAVEDPRGHFLRRTVWTQLLDFVSPRAWKQWMGMNGADEMDAPTKAPFYYLVGNFIIHFVMLFGVFVPVFKADKGLLWDKSGLILLNVVLMLLSWFFFYKTWKTPPGYLDNQNPHISTWRRRYEETLEAYAEVDDKKKLEALPPLCHTCHVARPLRSKHCRVSGKCVLMFDHYCPFVDNTVGLYNYRYFYLFLLAMTFGILSFIVTLIIYARRYHAEYSTWPVSTLLLGLEVGLCLMPVCGMALYHTQLSMVNLTTNEHINVRKYKYFFPAVNGRRQYRNPWFKGWLGNLMDRLQPSDACYIVPQEHQPLQTHDNIV